VTMRKTQPRDPPSLPWASPDQCVHPFPVALLKFQDSDETVFRCTACGELLEQGRPKRDAPCGRKDRDTDLKMEEGKEIGILRLAPEF
jgi:hypothetical protein